jgi:hypothetical protein
MATVAQAFDTFLRSLELTDSERKEASTQQKSLRDSLAAKLGGVQRDILSGSYSRRTAIRPLNDIDLFVILDPVLHKSCYPPAAPITCLQKIQSALKAAYPSHNPRLQGRSVHIDFTGTGIGYDVVPAFEEKHAGEYKIPDRDRGDWIRTNPEKHAEACKKANERAGDKLNRLVKAAKRWNCQQPEKAQLRSFHLEVMSYEAFSTGPESFAQGLADLFAFLANRVLSTCADPAGVGPNVDAGMTQAERTAARTALDAAAKTANVALALDRAGRTEEAHAHWRSLLGSDYPEKGR